MFHLIFAQNFINNDYIKVHHEYIESKLSHFKNVFEIHALIFDLIIIIMIKQSQKQEGIIL
jgi:hypothetical protein